MSRAKSTRVFAAGGSAATSTSLASWEAPTSEMNTKEPINARIRTFFSSMVFILPMLSYRIQCSYRHKSFQGFLAGWRKPDLAMITAMASYDRNSGHCS